MKKNTLLVLFQRSGTVVLFPLVLAAILGATSMGCSNTAGPETPGAEEGWSAWSEWSWSEWANDGAEKTGAEVWGDWETTEAATATTAGTGKQEQFQIYKQPQKRTGTRTRTRTVDGAGSPGGAAADVETQTGTTTETRDLERKEVVLGQTNWTTIPAGKKLNPDGSLSNLEIEGPGPKTVPSAASAGVTIADVDVIGIFTDCRAGNTGTYGLINADAVTIIADSLQGLIVQAGNLKAWLTTAATANAGNDLESIFADLATAQGGINKAAATSAVNFANVMDAQVGDMVTAIFGTDHAEFDKWLTAYTKSKNLVTRDWETDKDLSIPFYVDDCDSTVRSALQAISKGGLLIGEGGSYRGNAGLTDFNNKDNLLNTLETELVSRITEKLGVTDANATALAQALVTQFGDRAEFAAIIQDLDDATQNPNSNYADYTNALEVVNYSPYMTQAQTQSADVRLAHVGDGFEFPPEKIKGAGGVECTGDYTPVGRKNDGVGMA